MARKHTAEIGWTHPVTEEEFRVTVEITLGHPGRLYGPPEHCYPDEPAEIEVVSVVEDCPFGASRPDLIDLAQDCLGDEAEDVASSYAADAAADAAEARWEAREDR